MNAASKLAPTNRPTVSPGPVLLKFWLEELPVDELAPELVDGAVLVFGVD
jgi:hypothetical protein